LDKPVHRAASFARYPHDPSDASDQLAGHDPIRLRHCPENRQGALLVQSATSLHGKKVEQ
jgi:hypothetical protein